MSELVDPNVIAVDTETTGLDPDRRVWEVSLVRPTGAELNMLIDYDEADGYVEDEESLRIGGFYERWTPEDAMTEEGAASIVQQFTGGMHLVGANPAFDAEALAAMMRRCGIEPMWHHRHYDVSAMAAAALKAPIKGLRDTAMALGIDTDPYPLHTATGDARLAMDCYRTLMTGD